MNSILGNAAKGFPGLLGVLIGILLFTAGGMAVIAAIAAIAISLAVLWCGRRLLGSAPLLGLALIEVWIVAAVSVVALSTDAILWLTVHSPALFPLAEAQQRAVSGALVGGVTAYLAVLWTQDIAAGSGLFWPSTQFKTGLRFAFKKHAHAPKGDTLEYDSIYEERMRDGTRGWGFIARWKRADIISTHLKSR